MKTESRKTIFIAGHYGFGNTGDEAILSSIISSLRHQQFEFVVVSLNPSSATTMHQVRSIYWKDIPSLLDEAKRSDLIMIGGGGVFVDYWGVPNNSQLTEHHWGISYYNSIGILAALYNKPFMINSVGVGPLITEEGKRLTRQTFEVADVTTVRDKASFDLLQSIGVPAKKIRITTDPALGLAPDLATSLAIFQDLKVLSDEEPILGVCVRNWETGSKNKFWKGEVAAALDHFLETSNAKIVFVPFQKEERDLEDDVAVAREIASFMKNKNQTYTISEIYSPEIIKGFLSHCKVVVGMRLHSLIFSVGNLVPVIALAYDPKVIGFMESIDFASWTLELRQLDSMKLFQMISAAWNQSNSLHSTLKEVAVKTEKKRSSNSKLILDLLNGYSVDKQRDMEIELLREFGIKQTIALFDIERKLQSTLMQRIKKVLNIKPLYLIDKLNALKNARSRRLGSGKDL